MRLKKCERERFNISDRPNRPDSSSPSQRMSLRNNLSHPVDAAMIRGVSVSPNADQRCG